MDYARVNLTWFGFNFIKIGMPVYLTFLMDESAKPMIESRVDNISYKWLMYGCLGINVIQFIVTRRIYLNDYKEKKIASGDPFEID